MKKLLLYFVLICCCKNSIAQDPINTDSFKLVNIISGNYHSLEVDATGNIYLITAGNQLKKINSNGDSIAVFNDVRRYGNVSYLDVSNPLKTLVYYKNYSTILILDRLLSIRNNLNLRNRQIFRVNAITTSYDNNLWIFDEQEMKLKKISETGKLLTESNDLRLQTDKIPSAAFLTDVENTIYLYDPEQGLFLFDQYAAFKYMLPYVHWTSVSVGNNKLLGISNNKLNIYNMNSKTLRSLIIPETFLQANAIRVVNNKLYVLYKDSLCMYELP